jgi:hypothetical protein
MKFENLLNLNILTVEFEGKLLDIVDMVPIKFLLSPLWKPNNSKEQPLVFAYMS